MAVFISFNALAQIVGALLLYGCGSIKGAAIEGWRISFLICAALTVLVGAYFLIMVPATPASAWFLSPEERIVAVQRVAQERAVSSLDLFRPELPLSTLTFCLPSRPRIRTLTCDRSSRLYSTSGSTSYSSGQLESALRASSRSARLCVSSYSLGTTCTTSVN